MVQGKAMGMEQGRKFVQFITGCLNKLQTLPTGRRVVSEIDASGKKVSIFSCPRATEGGSTGNAKLTATFPESDGVYDLVNCQIRPFRPAQLNVPIDSDPSTIAARKDRLKGTGQPQTSKEAAPELFRILLRAKQKYPKPGAFLSQIVGKSQRELLDIVYGRALMDSDTYFKICLHFYEFLTPGPGVNTHIRMEWQEEFRGSSDGKFDPKKDYNDAPAFLVLGHELIHAWRMMQGRRIVDGGWEEEAMTTGIGPFAGWAVTENALRSEAGLPKRPYYGACPTVGSATTASIKEMTNQIGVRAQAKAGNKCAQGNLVQATPGWGDAPGWRKHGYMQVPAWGSPTESQMETPGDLVKRLFG